VKRFRLLMAASVLVAAMAHVPAADAGFPGQNGKIAFVASGDIWTMNPDGSGRAQLTGAAASEGYPSWSPDGTKILFSRSGQVHVMNADGSAVQQVTNRPGGAFHPDWFPDGTEIVYVGNNDVIYTANPDGTNEHALSYSTAPDFYMNDARPAWAPDGAEIAIFGESCGDETCGQLSVFTVRADGTGYRCCLGFPITFFTRHDWSPDARYLVAQDLRGPWNDGLGRDGHQSASLHIADYGTNAAWAPDGTKIVHDYATAFIEGRTGELMLINPDGTGEINITNTPSVDEFTPDWQPLPVNAYVRPKSASPVQVSLVPAYTACTSPNRQHGPPLAFGSCNPPVRASGQLTIGTADSNGKPTKSDSLIRLSALPGPPAVPGDQADVGFEADINDVYQTSLAEYTGELRAVVTLRITDKLNTPHPGGPGAATVSDLGFGFTIPCAGTQDPNEGSSCTIDTSADAVLPGAVTEGRRALWEVAELRVDDGGPDRNVHTPAGNTVFMRPGVFIP